MGLRIAGVCYVRADGLNLSVKTKAEYPLSPVVRENVMALAGSAGYSEKAQEPYLTLDAVTDQYFPRAQLANMTNATVTFEAANGSTYTLSGAFLSGETAVNAVDGSADLKFSGTMGTYSA